MEEFRDIEGYEGLYQVSNLGNVKSLKYGKERILKGTQNRTNHIKVRLCKNGKIKRYYVHRLVAQAFIPNPNNYPIINHKDENPKNNSESNLEWCTHKYNSNYGLCKKKMSESHKNKTPWNKGKTGIYSEETIKRLSEAHKGKKMTEQAKQKLSKSVIGINKINQEKLIFKSLIEASRCLNVDVGNIWRCCQGRYKQAGGYIWSYYEEG